MKALGLVGGIGPESTNIYYQEICRRYNRLHPEQGFPRIYLDSLNLNQVLDLAEEDNWDDVARLISESFNKLQGIGANIGAILSNTPHRVFDQIQEQSALPLVSILDATADEAAGMGLKKLLLLGTGFTMASDFYARHFEASGIEVISPDWEDLEYINEKIFSEVESNIIVPATKNRFLEIIESYQKTEAVEGVILGCTELPLLISPEDTELPQLDTLNLHIDAIVEAIR